MVVVGGQAPKAIRSVECYDFEEQRWYQVAELPTRRCRAGRKLYEHPDPPSMVQVKGQADDPPPEAQWSIIESNV